MAAMNGFPPWARGTVIADALLGEQRDFSAHDVVAGRHDLQLPLLDRSGGDGGGLAEQGRLDLGIGVDGSVKIGPAASTASRMGP